MGGERLAPCAVDLEPVGLRDECSKLPDVVAVQWSKELCEVWIAARWHASLCDHTSGQRAQRQIDFPAEAEAGHIAAKRQQRPAAGDDIAFGFGQAAAGFVLDIDIEPRVGTDPCERCFELLVALATVLRSGIFNLGIERSKVVLQDKVDNSLVGAKTVLKCYFFGKYLNLPDSLRW